MQNEGPLKPEALAEWRSHPVTEFLLAVLAAVSETNRQHLLDRAWNQGDIPPADRGRVQAALNLVDDLKEAKAEDWNEWAKQFGVEAL